LIAAENARDGQPRRRYRKPFSVDSKGRKIMTKALTRTSLLFAALIALSALVGAPAQAADRCTSASDCHGPLPQLCKKCKDGSDGCAHHACVHHKCVIRYCTHKY
jgi:hypothetical protein